MIREGSYPREGYRLLAIVTAVVASVGLLPLVVVQHRLTYIWFLSGIVAVLFTVTLAARASFKGQLTSGQRRVAIYVACMLIASVWGLAAYVPSH